jgi:hypothetical protein
MPEDRVMLKRLLAAAMGFLSLAVHASHLVRLDVDQKANNYTVYVVMQLDAPAEKVRAVLTDYAHLDRLNASITASKIIDAKGDGTATLRHEIRASFENLECLTQMDIRPQLKVQTTVAAEHQLNVTH